MTLLNELKQLEKIEQSAGKENGKFWTKQLETKVNYRGLIESYLSKSPLLQERFETGKPLVELVKPAFEEALSEYATRPFSSEFSSEAYRIIREDLVNNLIGGYIPPFKVGFWSLSFSKENPKLSNIISSIYLIAGSGSMVSIGGWNGSMETMIVGFSLFLGLIGGIGYSHIKLDRNLLSLAKDGSHSSIKSNLNYIDKMIEKYFL